MDADKRARSFHLICVHLRLNSHYPADTPWPRECVPSANSSIIFSLNAGMSFGLRLETRPLSTTTSSSAQLAPALIRSVLTDGHEVIRLPFTTSASISVHGP